jgi:FkbM family methyltransferase
VVIGVYICHSMNGGLSLRLASLLYTNAYSIYKPLYFRYKYRKDKFNLELIRKFIKPGSTIIDIGANIGFYSSFFSRLTGSNGHVYCFEPDKTNFRHLEKTLLGKINVTLAQKAVAAESGMLKLHPSSILNVDHRTYSSRNSEGGYEVEKISIDDYVDKKFKVDFIKMDIQGFETEALKGMNNTLAENPGILLLMEFWPYGLHEAGSSAEELFDMVVEKGFHPYRINEKDIIPFTREDALSMLKEYHTDCNVLLKRKDIL